MVLLCRRDKFFSFILFVFLVGCDQRADDFTAQHFTLENDLQLIVLPDSRFPIITQMVWYPVGSGDEVLSQTGIAHLFEHLMFQHEPHLRAGGFSALIENLGGRDNAFTSYDYTAYFQRFHPKQLEAVMALEAQRMADLTLNERTITKERKVVEEEFYQRQKGKPLTTLRNKMRAALYGKTHPYGRPVIGALKDIRALHKGHLIAFRKKYYNPARAFLILAGDITPRVALAAAKKFYEPLKTHHIKDVNDFAPVLQRQSEDDIIIHRDKRVKQAVLARTYTITNRHILGPKQAASFEVLAQLLVNRPQAKLNEHFIVKEKLASFVGGYLDINRRGPGSFSIEVWLQPKHKLDRASLQRTYRKLDKMLESFAAGKQTFTQEELTNAKNRLLAETVYATDNPFSLAQFVGAWLATGHNLDDAQQWTHYIDALTLNDVRYAAQYMLSSERAISGFLLPK